MRTKYRSNVDRSDPDNNITATIAPSIANAGQSWVTMSFQIEEDIAEMTVDKIKNFIKRTNAAVFSDYTDED